MRDSIGDYIEKSGIKHRTFKDDVDKQFVVVDVYPDGDVIVQDNEEVVLIPARMLSSVLEFIEIAQRKLAEEAHGD